ncbi:hypothetical protein G7Y79_00015g039130 [Physcia stellaris]|nr:hypothetical protein G7Y79_00015g039130 [Physcia stellaris]
MNHQNANAKTVIPAIPPMTPPTIAPVLEDEDRGVAVADAELETKDVDDVDSVDDALVLCDVADTAADPETSFPLTTNLPSFLAQQSRPPVRDGSPQQRLPSAQVVRGCNMLSLLKPKSSVYSLAMITGDIDRMIYT